jgi:glutamyl-tRNA reductase
MINKFNAVSLSHANTPLQVREIFALNEEQIKAVSLKIKDIFAVSELMIISTCNRSEIYYCSESDISQEIIKTLAAEKGIIESNIYLPYFQIHTDNEAVKRLFNVASGLDSKVKGDLQISNQVKQAYQISADLNLAGPFLHRLLHSIFFTNKRIAQETSFRDGTASVTYIAVILAEELAVNIPNPKILVFGLGEMGTNICKYLADKTFGNVTVMNRTLEKAKSIAQNFNFSFEKIENLESEIAKSDIIISSVRADNPLITKFIVSKNKINNFKYFIDLSVPRSVEVEVEQIPGALIYNIESLKAKADESLAKRLASVPEVEAIIQESIETFNDWNKEILVSPTIQKFKNALETIRKEEMSRFLKGMSAEQSELVDKITQSIIQKIIKQPVIQLKSACKRGEAENMMEAINELFDLEKHENTIIKTFRFIEENDKNST